MPHHQVLDHHKAALTPDPNDDNCDLDGRLLIKWKWLPKLTPEWKGRLSWIFIAAVLAEASFLVIQVIKTFQTKSAKDLSLPAICVLLATNLAWIAMSILVLKDYGVLLSGLIYSIASSVLIVGVVMYGGEDETVGDGAFRNPMVLT